MNLLIDVPFNREAAQEGAMYWTKEPGSLSSLIGRTDGLTADERRRLSRKAMDRILTDYTWEKVGAQYERLWARLAPARDGAR